MNEESYPYLYELTAGYLNQDYVDEHGDWENAVDAFIQEYSRDFLVATKDEISSLLALSMDDEATYQAATICSGYDPRLDGFTTYREWLLQVVNMLDQAITKGRQ